MRKVFPERGVVRRTKGQALRYKFCIPLLLKFICLRDRLIACPVFYIGFSGCATLFVK